MDTYGDRDLGQSNIGPVSSDVHSSKSMHPAPQALIQLSTKLNVMPAQPVSIPWFFQWWCAGFWSNRLQYHPSTVNQEEYAYTYILYINVLYIYSSLVYTVCLEKNLSAIWKQHTSSDGLHSRSLSCAQSSIGHDNDSRQIKHVLLLRLPKAHIESHCNFYRHLGFWRDGNLMRQDTESYRCKQCFTSKTYSASLLDTGQINTLKYQY